MRKAVLADTGPVYALADGHVRYHARAIRELKLLQQDNYQIRLLQPTIMEAYTLVMRYTGLSFAHQWLRSITEGCGLINPTRDDYGNAWELVNRYSDQKNHTFRHRYRHGVGAAAISGLVFRFELRCYGHYRLEGVKGSKAPD